MELPFCLCGCGGRVSSQNNSYINGHNKKNKKVSAPTKEKIREKLKGKSPWNKGKTKEASRGILNQSQKLKSLRNNKDSIYNSSDYKNNHLKAMNSTETKNKLRKKAFGRKSPNKGIKISKEQKIKISISLKMSISEIKEKYPTFSKIEEMRYNPEVEGEIQVHCKNHNCPNSKEQGGWFTPTYTQFQTRKMWIENEGKDLCYFYCCEECKNQCPLFRLRSDPFEVKTEKLYTQEEYQTFRDFVLERDNYICQYCGKLAEHVHHERPQKLEPFYSLDPDLAWSVCSECHYKYGHKDECSTGTLANKICF